MIIKNDLKELFHQLGETSEEAQVTISGVEITLRVFDHASKLSLHASVYFGGNYIPKSVRYSVSKIPPFPMGDLETYLTIDEPQFSIHLNYQSKMENITQHSFADVLEEFSIQADEWRLFLEERDRDDLVHVMHK